MRAHFAAVAVAAFAAVPATAQQVAYVLDVLDPSAPAVVRVELANAQASSTPIPIPADGVEVAPDGSSLIALAQSPGKLDFKSPQAWRPSGKARATIIRAGRTSAPVELGWGNPTAVYSSDGASVYVMSPGYETDGRDAKAGEVTRLDAARGEVQGRIALERGALSFVTDEARSTAAIISESGSLKKKRPTQITFVDLTSFEKGPTVDLPAASFMVPVVVGDLLYLASGPKLYVISMREQAVARTIDLDNDRAILRGPDLDGRIFVLTGAPKKPGRLLRVKGTEVVEEYAVPSEPGVIRLLDDGSRALVQGRDEMVILELSPGGKSLPAGPSPAGSMGTIVSADGRRVFVASMPGNSCCRITAIDAKTAQEIASFTGGSAGVRAAQKIVAAGLSLATLATARTTGTWSIYTPRGRMAGASPLVFGPGEKHVYVADTQSGYVTVVDAESGKRVTNIEAGAGLTSLYAAPEPNAVAAATDEGLTIIDAESHQVRARIALPIRLELTPDGRHFVAFGPGAPVVVVDAATMKEVGRSAPLKKPLKVVFPR